jgi:hypothetical protein
VAACRKNKVLDGGNAVQQLEATLVEAQPISRVAAFDIIQDFASCPLFRDASAAEMYIVGNPYRRPTRVLDNVDIDYSSPLTRNNLASNDSLSTHRLLLNIYEMDCHLLPQQLSPEVDRDRLNFYCADNQRRADLARPILEEKAFAFLRDEIEVTGRWTPESTMCYLGDFKRVEDEKLRSGTNESVVLARLLNSRDRRRCANHYLIQLASDFLSEASAMARYVPGNYGAEQSELFNILIDEYGYAVFDKKHSTLFERLLASVGLSAEIHRYWQFYQASSIMLTNYFHFLGRNKANYFRYLGALFFTEASLPNVNREQAAAIREIFGTGADVSYFTEHAHIDTHHGVMALERIIRPTLDRYGVVAATEIIRGFEEFKLLQQIADNDLLEQIKWIDGHQAHVRAAELIWSRISSGELNLPRETFHEMREERSTTHTHDEHRLVVLETGEMDFWNGFGDSIRLKAGDAHLVPRHRLHGSVITSSESLYHQPIVSEALFRDVLAQVKHGA